MNDLEKKENPEYKETDNINSVQSSLKSHPLWVTLVSNLLFTRFNTEFSFFIITFPAITDTFNHILHSSNLILFPHREPLRQYYLSRPSSYGRGEADDTHESYSS